MANEHPWDVVEVITELDKLPELVVIRDGSVFKPARVEVFRDGDRMYYLADSLRKDGTPRQDTRRSRGHINDRRYGDVGDVWDYDETRERRAHVIRDTIRRLNEDLDMAQTALDDLYRGGGQ